MDENREITYAFPKDKRIDPSSYIDAYNLVLQCSQANSPRGFAIQLVELLRRVCPFDYAIVFFLDANHKVSGYYTVGIDERWLEVYLEYYLKLNEYPHDLNLYQSVRENSNFSFEIIIRWKDVPKSEFTQDYIQELGIHYSWGFTFFDLNGDYRVIFSIDRTKDEPFSTLEQDRLRLALPILNNILRNFFYQSTDNEKGMLQSPWKRYRLTKREIEIANLLCQGMSVKNISSALYIAIITTYKHIAHIYEKVGVSTQQELLVKALNKKGYEAKYDLVIKDIIERQQFPVTAEELKEEAEAIAMRQNATVEMVKRFFGEDLKMLKRDIRIRKAEDWICQQEQP